LFLHFHIFLCSISALVRINVYIADEETQSWRLAAAKHDKLRFVWRREQEAERQTMSDNRETTANVRENCVVNGRRTNTHRKDRHLQRATCCRDALQCSRKHEVYGQLVSPSSLFNSGF